MRYQIPQFIEVEDKIIGPFTIKQFLYLAGGGGMAFIAYTLLPLFLSIFVIPAIIILSLALTFYKVNNKNFVEFLESVFSYYTKERLYIWKKIPKKIEPKKQEEVLPNQMYVPKLSDSKLKDLAWNLDINENLNPLTGRNGKTTK
ncbi:MAG: PrgI family protein [Candidatus Paceibacterota bacterium]